MREVNDHFIDTHADGGDKLWHRATYMAGNMEAALALDEPTYWSYGASWARSHDYAINRNADNHCAGQTYLVLYDRYVEGEMLRNIKNAADFIIDSGERDDWYWIDAQFMASPVFARLGAVTGAAKYTDTMHELFVDARDRRGLYDPTVGLWYRDEAFLYPANKTQNGEKIFWSRGNGWVIASLARTLEYLAEGSPYRLEYEDMLRAMATALAAVQREDGLWNVSLADANEYPGPESSGTAFFIYAIAWGINHGVLDRATFSPVVERGWRGLVETAVRADGELGYVQGVADQPSSAQPVTIRTTRDYAVGAFLLAGTEVMKLGVDFDCP